MHIAFLFTVSLTFSDRKSEWGMRSVQSGFQQLKLSLPASDTARSLILRVIFRLHNFRVAEMKIS
ncbi:hypothetical protein BJV82DRAFT_613590 [Fennellomyces sp. T-0311]|nr:hypothetical protein BJV82DRAFT_613590 [Fennellomyces sp. T-0311]